MNKLHIAQGAETRMSQLRDAIAGARPDGTMGVAWDMTGPLRESFPSLQKALAKPVATAIPTLDADAIATAIVQRGVRLPARPTRFDQAAVPREGARLVGHADEAIPFVDTVALTWLDDACRARGMRGDRLHAAVAKGMESPDVARVFGVALADAAFGVPGAELRGMPAGFEFAYDAVQKPDDSASEFAEAVAGTIGSLNGMSAEEGLFEGYVLLGRYERVNGLAIDALFYHQATRPQDDVGSLAYDCARASLGLDNTLSNVIVPVFRYDVEAPGHERFPAPGM